jgi:hypothetical protein
MADPFAGVMLPNVEVKLEDGCLCRECGQPVTRVEIPLAVETGGDVMHRNELVAKVITGTPVQQPCGHPPLDISPRPVATIEGDADV